MAEEIGDEVVAAAIFGCGMGEDWGSFDILGHDVIADAIAEVNAQEGEHVPENYHIESEIPNRGTDRIMEDVDTIIIHSTRSGRDWTPEQELQATLNHFRSPTSQASSIPG